MPRQLEIHGVPKNIAMDGWRLETAVEPVDTSSSNRDGTGGADPEVTGERRGRWVQFIAIALLADFLFWDQRIGISLVFFAIGLVLIAGRRSHRSAQIKAGLLCLLGALPVVDSLQPLSVVFLVIGSTTAIVTLNGQGTGLPWLASQVASFLIALPGQWLRSLHPAGIRRMRTPAQSLASTARLASLTRDWAFPLGGSLVFLALLMDANPIFLTLGTEHVDFWRLCQRATFWVGVMVLTAPFLLPVRSAISLPDFPEFRLPRLGLNMRSVLRALFMFNVLIGVQMMTDIAILVGGAELPSGMTYAEYAHRGAYPLLATAMLAMAFAVLARPFWHGHRLIQPLMLLWLLQNVVLTGAAALRLDLYIEVYGLTYLRLYALIWMALVACGLGLAIVQMALSRGTEWLAAWTAGLGAVTIYACAFVNFAAIIAAQNLSRPDPDLAYVCDLGPMAAAEMAEAKVANPYLLQLDRRYSRYCQAEMPPQIEGWRDWGLRNWRVNRMVENSGPGAG
ncbi:MAG: DUF4173 domain-containing protein [Paracoccaceae bacterium]